jgi:predicted cupin superfamily sugar epimerase
MDRGPTEDSLTVKDAAYWIRTLDLKPHPEGGYYRQTYRSDLQLPKNALPPEFSGPRPASTSIYYLLDGDNFSAFHRLRSDELWHFHLGAPLLVHVIETDGSYSKIQLGNNPEAGEVFQAAVKAGCWFASQLSPLAKRDGAFALVGCTVAPGFDFEDFELGKRESLLQSYPQHRDLIRDLTRQ